MPLDAPLSSLTGVSPRLAASAAPAAFCWAADLAGMMDLVVGVEPKPKRGLPRARSLASSVAVTLAQGDRERRHEALVEGWHVIAPGGILPDLAERQGFRAHAV